MGTKKPAESPVGICVGREYRQRFGQGGQHASHRVAQGVRVGIRGSAGRRRRKDVPPGPVQKAEMDVHAGAVQIHEGLGHEGRGQAVLPGDASHQAAEEDGVIAGREGVVHVMQVDLELAGAIFRHNRSCRHTLLLGCRRNPGKETIQVVQILEAVGPAVRQDAAGFLVRVQCDCAAPRHSGRQADGTVVLDSDHGGQPRAASAQDAGKHMARVGKVGASIPFIHRDEALAKRGLRPGHPGPGCRRPAGTRNRDHHHHCHGPGHRSVNRGCPSGCQWPETRSPRGTDQSAPGD